MDMIITKTPVNLLRQRMRAHGDFAAQFVERPVAFENTEAFEDIAF
jgi:hypothetical protein